MRSGDIGKHPAAAMARVEQSTPAQGRENRAVEPTTLALAQQRTIPIQTQPFQISHGLGLSARAVARRIEIIDAQQPLRSAESCLQPGEQCSAQVAHMQRPTGGGGITATKLDAALLLSNKKRLP